MKPKFTAKEAPKSHKCYVCDMPIYPKEPRTKQAGHLKHTDTTVCLKHMSVHIQKLERENDALHQAVDQYAPKVPKKLTLRDLLLCTDHDLGIDVYIETYQEDDNVSMEPVISLEIRNRDFLLSNEDDEVLLLKTFGAMK